MLQETHLTAKEGEALKKRWRGEVYYTAFSAYARGVLIWIRSRVPFQLTESLVDPEGHYVVLVGRLEGRDVVLVNIYAPNVDQGIFFDDISRKLAAFLVCPIILEGTFNCVADPNLDRSHTPLRDSPIHRTARLFSTWQSRWGRLN